MTSAQTEKASSRLRRAGRARAASTARRAAAYTVLGLLCFLCLFFFYILLINATRTHFEIQRGFSLLPGRSLLTNLKSVLANANIPVLSGIRNSLLVSALSALLSVYFSALTAYGIHAYDFKFKKLAFTFILLIMMMPTQVSALGFVRLITKMGMADTLAPLFLPSIAAPVVFYFMLQYMEGNLPMEIDPCTFRVPGASAGGRRHVRRMSGAHGAPGAALRRGIVWPDGGGCGAHSARAAARRHACAAGGVWHPGGRFRHLTPSVC